MDKPVDIIAFLDRFISYGCVDCDNVKYVNTLGGSQFRTRYRTLGLRKSLLLRIGCCIERNDIVRFICSQIGLPCRSFCLISSRLASGAKEKVLFHCFALVSYRKSVYYVEHSDLPSKGAYPYCSTKAALSAANNLFAERYCVGPDSIVVSEYANYVPAGLTLSEVYKFITC